MAVRSNHRMWSLACALLLALPAPCAENPDWSELDSGTRELLAPWRDNWATLAVADRTRLLANTKRWQAMDSAAHDAFGHRSADWQALSPAERARRRARYAAWRALPPDDQARIRAAAARFAALPAAQQATMRARFAMQDANRQLDWLSGPSTGEWIGQARALFAFVPDGERDATLRMLQALPADTRGQLFTLARRLPDDQRERLRKQLLATDPAQRAALLRQRMSQ